MQTLGFIGGEDAEDKNKSRGKPKLATDEEGVDASDASSSEEEQPTEAPKPKRRGANRKRKMVRKQERSLCSYIVSDRICPFGDQCRYSHDVSIFASNRPADISDSCPIFALSGHCRYGVTCRFGSKHIGSPPEYKNLVDEERTSAFVSQEHEERNSLPSDLIVVLRKKRYNFSFSNSVLSSLPKPVADSAAPETTCELANNVVTAPPTAPSATSTCAPPHTLGAVTDADTIRLRSTEVPKVRIIPVGVEIRARIHVHLSFSRVLRLRMCFHVGV